YHRLRMGFGLKAPRRLIRRRGRPSTGQARQTRRAAGVLGTVRASWGAMRSLAPWCILLAPATLPAQATEVPPLEAARRAEVALARLRARVRVRAEGVRAAAAFAVGAEGLRLAADGPLAAVRRAALTPLAHRRDPRAGDALLARLDDPALQVTAAEALA